MDLIHSLNTLGPYSSIQMVFFRRGGSMWPWVHYMCAPIHGEG